MLILVLFLPWIKQPERLIKMSKIESKIVTQLLTSIENQNFNKFQLALAVALAQQPPINLNKIQQNGHTILTFAGW